MNQSNFTCNHINQKQLANRWGLSERALERWLAGQLDSRKRVDSNPASTHNEMGRDERQKNGKMLVRLWPADTRSFLLGT